MVTSRVSVMPPGIQRPSIGRSDAESGRQLLLGVGPFFGQSTISWARTSPVGNMSISPVSLPSLRSISRRLCGRKEDAGLNGYVECTCDETVGDRQRGAPPFQTCWEGFDENEIAKLLRRALTV